MTDKKLKIPPHNLEAEESVLGALMLDSKSIFQIADLLRKEDFYSPSNSKIYESILRLYERHQPIDLVSIKSDLRETGDLDNVGGTAHLTKLIESVPTASHIEHYAKIVKNKKILRDLVTASAEIHETAFGEGESDNIEGVLDSVEKKIFSISQSSTSQRFVQVRDELNSAYERIERLHQGEKVLSGLPTGFPGLDNMLSGFHKSDLIILGARPSLGKTALALDIARHLATKEKKSVALFSLEMSKEQIIDRLIASEAGVPLWNLRTGRLKDEIDFQLVQAALDTLSGAKLFVDDAPSPTVLQMRSMARRLQMEHGVDLVVVDYLQLAQAKTRSDSPVQQITEISRGLKAMARELQVPVLALSQLSRGVEQRERQRPRLSDLRDSGSIEQDADVVMFIYRKDKMRPDLTTEEQNITEILIEKHRNGPTGVVQLQFDQERASFRSIDRAHSVPQEATELQ
jgi:replicative DNA helicase